MRSALPSEAGSLESLEEVRQLVESDRNLRLPLLDQLLGHLARINVARLDATPCVISMASFAPCCVSFGKAQRLCPWQGRDGWERGSLLNRPGCQSGCLQAGRTLPPDSES